MKTNVLKNLPDALPDELLETLFSGSEFRVERIVSDGHHSAEGFWYDQQEHEWVLILQGSARLEFAHPSEILELKVGDCVLIPSRRRHRVAETDPSKKTVWLAIFFQGDLSGVSNRHLDGN